MKIVVVSATSLIARNCIQVWAEQADHDFLLVGRDESRLKSTANDLAIRYPKSNFKVEVVDILNPSAVEAWCGKIGKTAFDLALIAQGSLTDQARATHSLDYLNLELSLNVNSTALFLEGFATLFENANHGQIGVFGSVAGDRGRAYNYSYGASKAMIATYVQGLQQRLASTNVTVSMIKPGPTATPMTVTHTGNMASPHQVAQVIVRGLAGRKRVIYAPRVWALIMFVVRLIPFTIFKRLHF